MKNTTIKRVFGENMFPRKCDVTGKPMTKGFVIADGADYCLDDAELIKYLHKETEFKTIKEAVDEDYVYFTEWGEDECADEFYDENGVLIDVSEEELQSALWNFYLSAKNVLEVAVRNEAILDLNANQVQWINEAIEINEIFFEGKLPDGDFQHRQFNELLRTKDRYTLNNAIGLMLDTAYNQLPDKFFESHALRFAEKDFEIDGKYVHNGLELATDKDMFSEEDDKTPFIKYLVESKYGETYQHDQNAPIIKRIK